MRSIIGDVNKSNFNTIENEKEFMNNSMVMSRRRKNYNDIYYPKFVDPNLEENESIYGKKKIEIKEEKDLYNKNNYINNNNNPYKKMNIRYQKMYYDNDIISENRNNNLGLLEEQTNEGTN